MKLRVSGRAEMAATAGPGGGAQVKNTSTNSNSTNSNTPNSRTTFKEVTSLIKVFDKEPAMAVIEEVKTTPPQGGNSGPPPQEAALTTPTLEEDTMEAEASNGDSSPPTSTAVVSWARTADRSNLEQPYKLKLWFRKNSTASTTTLSTKEKGRLIFKRLGVPKGKCLVCNVSRRDCIILTIDGSVPLNSLKLSQSLEAKPGLMTKPIAPVVKEKEIFIYWTTAETEYRELEWTLEQFGVLTSNIEHQVYKAKPDADEDEKLMDGVMSMDRVVKMKVRKNIPSIILVGNKKVSIRYEGQARSCPRCLLRLHQCPTKGDPRRCQDMWENRSGGPDDRSKPRGDLEDLMRKVTTDEEPSWGDDSGETSGIHADHVDLTNLPPEMTKAILLDHIKKKDIAIKAGQIMRHEDDKTKWKVTELLPQEVQCFMMLIHGNKIGKDGRKIECFPALTSTPKDKSSSAVDKDNLTKKNLAEMLSGADDGDEVSPNDMLNGTNVKASSVLSNNLISNNLPKDQVNSGDSSESSSDDDMNGSSYCKEVTADGDTLPRPGSGNAGEAGKPKVVMNLKKTEDGTYSSDVVTTDDDDEETRKVKKAKRRMNDPKNTTLGVKPPATRTQTPAQQEKKELKAMTKLKDQAEEAKLEYERLQKEAEERSEKANGTMEEKDLKDAEKAEKAAAAGKRKWLTLVKKHDDAMKNIEKLKTLHAGKRGPENQSPGKEGEGPEKQHDGSQGSGTKGRNLKKKTKEEIELEKSFFN